MNRLEALQEFYGLAENIKTILSTAENVVEDLIDHRDLSPESRKKGAEYLEQLSFDLRIRCEVANALLEGDKK